MPAYGGLLPPRDLETRDYIQSLDPPANVPTSLEVAMRLWAVRWRRAARHGAVGRVRTIILRGA